jgi:uncharacterized membrane protein (DUF485 family)
VPETDHYDWQALASDARFQTLHRRKTRFLWGLMMFSVAYYFLLPVGAAYFQDWFRIRVHGPINVGILFALSEFVVAWGVAFLYTRKANAEFDTVAAAIREAAKATVGSQP